MPEVPLQFPWRVDEDGYGWIDSFPVTEGDGRRRPFLTDGRPIATGGFRVMQYQPLSAFTGLFRMFADTEPDQDGIEAFADRFGRLGGDIACTIPLFDKPSSGGGVPVGTGEPLSAWSEEILTMRIATDLWEAARSGDVSRLERVIHWTEDGSGVRVDTHPDLPADELPQTPFRIEREWIAGVPRGNDARTRFMPGDLVRPALHHVQSMINKRLRGRVSPRLLWDVEGTRLGLYIVPEGLIGALWLQFARAVERDSQFRKCAECGDWFELASGTARADKLYCSTSCRTRAYRRRKLQAARLHDEGRSIGEIAEALQSEPETVRGWLQRRQIMSAAPDRTGSR